MLWGWGLVDDGQEAELPQAQLEIEVETETSPAEVEDSSKMSTQLPPSPHLPTTFMAPFDTGKQFGEWVRNGNVLSKQNILARISWLYEITSNIGRQVYS